MKASSVLIVGAGGLGCPAAQYLAGSGVGHIGLIDYDEVERSNLHRQLLHSEESIGISKVSSAAAALRKCVLCSEIWNVIMQTLYRLSNLFYICT